MKLKLGLIGLPTDWQKHYLPALRVLQDRFEVVGVYSSVSTLADKVAREFSAERFDGFRQMVKQDNIDAVMLLASDWYGLVPIEAACDFGKAVYCGSEIDFAPHQASRLSKSVEQSGIAFMAEFPRRYAPASLRLKELIATRLGKPQILFCHRRLTNPPGETARNAKSLDARADRELMELIDWCSFIVGRSPNSIQCVSHQTPRGPHLAPADNKSATRSQFAGSDYQALSLDFSEEGEPAGSTVAQLSCGSYIRSSWHEAATFRPPAAVQVCCENGLAFVDLPNSLTWFDDAGRHQEALDSEMAVGQQLLIQFYRAVTSLVRKMGDLEDVNRCLTALLGAQQSSRERRLIPLNTGTPPQ
ncbi:Gfo/Idh/MocA family protein [Aureliella helgolandensis]|uniref:Oxidoreductase family, NAD-binding Rossmann fold n=1 Tax=Aureliella helgolandensis TaxID=2527968 RepID=A0A518G6N4_9BACT|nr:Gfo/Idh/MocA family oxidoreductase [Aureliella helgolandensis]QDV24234.1 Oxidoreductase family, NAD-binding Rossmann fold [Aureliella helgolandensis]